MARHADIAVRAADRVDGKTLDFSVESLTWIDTSLGEFPPSNQVAETVFSFGAYVGEVMVRNNPGARWVESPAAGPMAAGWPLVELPGSVLVNPIAKAFKRVDLGEGENIPYFYSVFSEPTG